jgi:hypothetical protein
MCLGYRVGYRANGQHNMFRFVVLLILVEVLRLTHGGPTHHRMYGDCAHIFPFNKLTRVCVCVCVVGHGGLQGTVPSAVSKAAANRSTYSRQG